MYVGIYDLVYEYEDLLSSLDSFINILENSIKFAETAETKRRLNVVLAKLKMMKDNEFQDNGEIWETIHAYTDERDKRKKKSDV